MIAFVGSRTLTTATAFCSEEVPNASAFHFAPSLERFELEMLDNPTLSHGATAAALEGPHTGP